MHYHHGMCLIALAWKVHPRYPLVLIANRDEAHARPTAAADYDPDAPDVYGGRDLVAGGGWLQVSARARLAAVTNVRNGHAPEAAARSRGWLVRDFVRGAASATTHAASLQPLASGFGRFNLLLWDGDELAFGSNHPAPVHHRVAPGIHAMSNGAFDAPWPKSGHATRALAAWIEAVGVGAGANGNPACTPDLFTPLFDALTDTTAAPDAALPDTGVGLALERRLSPPFIVGREYGTRCSTVVLAGQREIVFLERRFGPDAVAQGESRTTLARA